MNLKPMLWMTVLLLAGLVLPGRAGTISNDDCLQCHGDNTLTITNAQGQEVSLFVNVTNFLCSVHRTNSCVSCHTDATPKHPDDNLTLKEPTCIGCHDQEVKDYTASIHGMSHAMGASGAAQCWDCHGKHDMLPVKDPLSPVYKLNLPQTCAKCHASANINATFNLPSDRVQTFLGSYHGLAVKGGSASAANCASCHGYHKILPSSDPDSTINRRHLVETCGKCHPGATENFALSPIHVDDTAAGTDKGAVLTHWVRHIYLGMIFAVVGGLTAHNLIAWLRSALAARRRRGVTVMRMSRHHRIQHFILLSSFILLALTGFALKYPDTWLAWLFGADENVRRWLHRGAGMVLIGIGIYHLVYIIAARKGRELVKDFWPRWQDAKDITANLRYLTGHSRERPKFGRFGYPEKLEYWAVAWGIVIMGLTGLVIWFKMDVTKFLPRWVIDVALTVHYYEAILACLAIVVWHFYHIIFAPDSYPMNWAWWDGQVTEEWQHEEHPLDQSTPPPAADQKTVSKTTGDGI